MMGEEMDKAIRNLYFQTRTKNKRVEQLHTDASEAIFALQSTGSMKAASSKTSPLIAYGKLIVAVARFIVAKHLFSKHIKKHLSKLIICKPSEIACTQQELADLAGKAKGFIGDFRYNASISKGCLESIVVFYGDAYLEALDDFSCLKSLRVICGKSGCADAERT